MCRSIAGTLATIALAFAAACQREAGAVQGDADGSSGATTASSDAARGNGNGLTVKTWPVDADPCGWVTAAEVAKIIGPLEGAPWRASHADGAERDEKGHACGYTLAVPNGARGGDERIAVEVSSVDVTTSEAGLGMMRDRFSKEGTPDAFKIAADIVGLNKKTRPGWDYTGGLPDLFTARIGALAINVGIYTRVNEDSIARLAMLVRERIPDLPKLAESAAEHISMGSENKDACTLLTQAEAEAVLGKLTMPPYRSDHDSPDADPGGEGCSYYMGNHRVFTINPSWDQGKTLFKMLAGFNQGVTNAVGAKGESADTLEGNWDQVGAGPGGANLYFLKGDKMLEVSFATAAIDKTKALKLATIALERLAKASSDR